MTRLNDITTHARSTSKSISPRFDELAVVLPEYVEQPTLKTLIRKVQGAMLSEQGLSQSHGDSSQSASGQSASSINTPSHSTLSNRQAIADGKAVSLNDDTEITNSEDKQPLGEGDITRSKTILDKLISTDIADASVLVVITNEPHPKMLLTRRAAHLNSHAGEVSFVGGKHDNGDGNNVVTALREACEETALPPNKVKLVGQLPTQTSKKGLIVRPIIALVEPGITYVPELGEIGRIFWADFETLITAPTTDHILSYPIDGKMLKIKTPSWVVDEEVVWGLTGRIICTLLEVGFGRQLDWYYLPVEDPLSY